MSDKPSFSCRNTASLSESNDCRSASSLRCGAGCGAKELRLPRKESIRPAQSKGGLAFCCCVDAASEAFEHADLEAARLNPENSPG